MPRDSSFSLASFAALHHPQDCETPGVEKDSVVPVAGTGGRGSQHGSSVQVKCTRPPRSRPALRLRAQQFRLQLTPRQHFLPVFETGGHCTDIYYALQTFP